MESYRIFFPSSELSPYVRYYWMLRAADNGGISERTVPTGCMSLVFHRLSRGMTSDGLLQPRFFVSGFSEGFSDLNFSGEVDMIVVVLQPCGIKALFGVPAGEFSGLDVSVADLGDGTWSELEKRLWEVTDENGRIVLIERFLVLKLKSLSNYELKRIAAAVDAASRESSATVRDLARKACLSERQLGRVFLDTVGASPKDFIRIIRFQRALYLMSLSSSPSLAQIAADAGYYDQSHMIREFKRLSGYTPMEYMAVCAPFSDYFSTFK